jgi:hypothetical protein
MLNEALVRDYILPTVGWLTIHLDVVQQACVDVVATMFALRDH